MVPVNLKQPDITPAHVEAQQHMLNLFYGTVNGDPAKVLTERITKVVEEANPGWQVVHVEYTRAREAAFSVSVTCAPREFVQTFHFGVEL